MPLRLSAGMFCACSTQRSTARCPEESSPPPHPVMMAAARRYVGTRTSIRTLVISTLLDEVGAGHQRGGAVGEDRVAEKVARCEEPAARASDDLRLLQPRDVV